MRLSATRSCQAGRTKRRAISIRVVAASILLAATGCVSAGSHREVVAERDRLTRQKVDLARQLDRAQKSNASLDANNPGTEVLSLNYSIPLRTGK